jgi:site-specific recombinase XerD
MASIKLFFDTRRTKIDETYPLKLKLFHQDKARYIPLRFSFKKNQWISKDQKVHSSYPNSGRVNATIRKLLTEASIFIAENESKVSKLSIDELKRLLVKTLFDEEEDKIACTLFSFSKELIEQLKKSGRVGTASSYNDALNSIKNYLNNEDINLTEVDHKFLTDYETYCLGMGLKVNSVGVYLRSLRAIINRAIDNQLILPSEYPFRKFRIKAEKTAKRAIPKKEIQRIIDLELEVGTNLWHDQNYFVFMFNMVGMNYIDMAYLKMRNITNGRLIYKRRKTKKIYNLKITTKAAEILRYYTNGKKKNSESYVFPIMPEEGLHHLEKERKIYVDRRKKFNQNLKKIAALCQIDTNLTSYVSRHSWASIGKFSGVAPAILGESLGHSDLKTTETYLANFDHQELDEANELIVG